MLIPAHAILWATSLDEALLSTRRQYAPFSCAFQSWLLRSSPIDTLRAVFPTRLILAFDLQCEWSRALPDDYAKSPATVGPSLFPVI